MQLTNVSAKGLRYGGMQEINNHINAGPVAARSIKKYMKRKLKINLQHIVSVISMCLCLEVKL